MTQIDYAAERYSVCIAYEAGPDKEWYARVADYLPDEAEEGNELVPALMPKDFDGQDDPGFKFINPRTVFCPEAHRAYPSRLSDVYLLEWRPADDDHSKQISRICRRSDGLPTSDDVREVITIPSVKCADDLVQVLKDGYPLKRKTTREFYLVYELPAGGYMRYAVKCKRDDFVDAFGFLRLSSSLVNTRQTVLSAPIVVLDEEKIIKASLPTRGTREIYSSLRDLDEDEGRLLLRPIEYYAADYVRYYLEHCETTAKLTDKERRYAVARAIDEALQRPDELAKYLGAECPESELAKLRKAIAPQVKARLDDDLKLVQVALLEDEEIFSRCVEQAKRENAELLGGEQKRLAEAEARLAEAKKQCESYEHEIAGREAKIARLKEDEVAAEARLAEAASAEERATRELENNIGLKLGLGAIARNAAGSCGGVAPSLTISGGTPASLPEEEGDLLALLEKNYKSLGISGSSQDVSADLHSAALGVCGCVAAKMPMAIPEPVATPIATALAAALYSASPTRVVVPADYRNHGKVEEAVKEPGVYLIEGVIDSVNEGVLFPLLRQQESSLIIFPFRSHASALLLAREAWDGMFMPAVESLAWAPFLRRKGELVAMSDSHGLRIARAGDVEYRAGEIAGELEELALPFASYLLPAAISLVAEDACEEADIEVAHEPVVAQHLAMASGASAPALGLLEKWSVSPGAESWVEVFRKRLGMSDE